MKIDLPKSQGKTYEQYRIELTAWREVTDLDKKQTRNCYCIIISRTR